MQKVETLRAMKASLRWINKNTQRKPKIEEIGKKINDQGINFLSPK